MSEDPKSEIFTITNEFRKFCSDLDINPEKLLERFMADCVGGDDSSGSDERANAAAYVDRLGPNVYNDVERFYKRKFG